MASTKSFALDEYYHLFNHGNGDRLIFLDDKDKERFSKLLYLANGSTPFDFEDISSGQEFFFDRGDPLVAIGAWCLMDNHYHLLVKEITDGGISRFMHRLATGYTMYFNRCHKKRGSLFESCFRAKYLGLDEYLRHMFAYIHLNPVKMIEPRWKDVGLKDLHTVKSFLRDYKFSSYLDYLGQSRPQNKILDKEAFPKYFLSPQEIEDEMIDWLDWDYS